MTSASVLTIILLERGMLRRDYAQVTLAVGVASEVLAFIWMSVAASLGGSSSLQAGVGSALTALGVVLFVLTLGRRITFWALRGVADRVPLARGPLSLVLVLTFLAAALTHGLGLHPLLGAFLVGMLLRGAPRVSPPLLQSVQTVTIGLFAPVFFVLAGMHVDLTQLGGPSALLTMALLLAVALTVKIVFGGLGARVGGLSWWESALVGVGVCLRGGTDVIVAIIGTELGLLSDSLYTMYAVVAMLSVVIVSPLLKALAAKAPPLCTWDSPSGKVEAAEERERLARLAEALAIVARAYNATQQPLRAVHWHDQRVTNEPCPGERRPKEARARLCALIPRLAEHDVELLLRMADRLLARPDVSPAMGTARPRVAPPEQGTPATPAQYSTARAAERLSPYLLCFWPRPAGQGPH